MAALNQVSKSLAIVESDLASAREHRSVASSSLGDLQKEIAAGICAMMPSLPTDWSLSKLESWLGKRSKALETYANAEQASRDIWEAEQDAVEIRRRLIDAVSLMHLEVPSDASSEALLALLEAAAACETERKALQLNVGERERDLRRRENRVRKCADASRIWDEAWAAQGADCWLGQDGSTPGVPIVREVLKELESLRSLIQKRDSLADRIQKMEVDQGRFVDDAMLLATALQTEITADPLDFAAQAAAELRKAQTSVAARQAAILRLKDAELLKSTIDAELETHRFLKATMTTHFGVETLEDVDAKLRDLDKRRELEEHVGIAELEILDALGAPSIEIAEEVLDSVDRNEIEAEIAELGGRFEDQEVRTRELFNENSKASDRLESVGGDDAVARIEERRRTTLLEIEERAKRYLRLKLGIAAAEQALRLYRDRHRSSMMARASEAFKTISRGEYRGLTTQPDGASEILVAVSVRDGAKIASDLSKGTRFQLYLALRVAGYLEFAESRRPVPFIADDIMETFDDFRAEEALKLFGEMARVGQVIYLTHHLHLCEIARRVCPGVHIHELNAVQLAPLLERVAGQGD